MKVVGL